MWAAEKAFYQEQGFVIIENVVPHEYIQDLFQTVAKVLHKHCPHLPDFSAKSWSDPEFNLAMQEFRAAQPVAFGYLFDTVQTSTALWRLGTDRKLCEIAAELMDDTVTGLSVSDLLLRMDAPQDTRNKLEWHQDSSYFRQNDLGQNGCVCTMTMRDLAISHGPLEILPHSHEVGRIHVTSSGKQDSITSEQYRIAPEIIAKFTPEQVMYKAGAAIFFNFDLIHRSGFNSSNLFRFTAIARYHRMLTSDFKAGRLVYRQRGEVTGSNATA